MIGYSSRLSGRANERIDFMVSSEHEENYTARLFRSISADPNPQGMGLVEYACDDLFREQSFISRKQRFSPGSYGITTEQLKIRAEQKIMFSLL
ncbi:MAG: N,N-dimethylformamidase large subunit, partial [Rhodobacteraceae bacterium]|nr:N,N-dimethylformamidase large subunit [Paracoccaceae bacterium]